MMIVWFDEAGEITPEMWERLGQMTAKKHDLVDIDAVLHVETDAAYRIDDGKTVDWVPKSLVEKNEDGTFTMP